MKHIFLLWIGLMLYGQADCQVWEHLDADIPPAYYVNEAIPVDHSTVWVFAVEMDTFSVFYTTDVGHLIRRSVDGGQSWSAIDFPGNEPGYFSHLHPVNRDTAWIAYTDYTDGSCPLYKSINGGQSWEKKDIGITVFVNNIHFFNDLEGVVMADADSLGWQIYTTDDGGESWSRVDPAGIAAPVADEYGFAGYYESIGDHIFYGTSAGRIFYTMDKGHSWETVNGPLSIPHSFFSAVGTGSLSQPSLLFISYTSAANPDGTEPSTRLFKSFDNGQAWDEVALADHAWWIQDISNIPGTNVLIGQFNQGYLADVPNVVETRLSYDFGLSWTTIDDESVITLIKFLDSETGYSGSWLPRHYDQPGYITSYNGNPISGLFDPQPLKAEISISPNPTAEYVRIIVEAEDSREYVILLNDADGRLLHRETIPESRRWNHSLDLRTLSSGAYFVTLSTKDGVRTTKLIKE